MHDAGYNIFTYDLRNHGESGEGGGGICGIGRHEWKDGVGAVVANRQATRGRRTAVTGRPCGAPAGA